MRKRESKRGGEAARGKACWGEHSSTDHPPDLRSAAEEPATHLNAQGIETSRLERTFTTDHIWKLLYLTDKNDEVPGKLTYQEYPVN